MAVYEGTRVAYFAGTRLWEIVQEPPFDPAEPGSDTRHTGATRTWATQRVASPNYSRDLVVETVVGLEPGTQMASPVNTDLESETAMSLLLAQLEAQLISLATQKRHLAYAQAEESKATVKNGPYAAAGAVDHNAPANDWTPAAGDYVLLRNPTTEAGFVAQISSVTDPDTVVLAEAETGTWQTVTSDWEMIYVQLAYTGVRFSRMSKGSRAGGDNPTKKALRRGVEYHFVATSVPLYASKHAIARGNS